MNYKEIVDDLPIGELENTDKSPFWYTGKDFSTRYQHETGKVGDMFYDGNNGDKWRVLAINTKFGRAIIKNCTQGGTLLAYWN